MHDILAFFAANLISMVLFYIFSHWMKKRSAWTWIAVFLIIFPQIEAVNSPGMRFWPIFGGISSIIGMVILVRVLLGAGKMDATDRMG